MCGGTQQVGRPDPAALCLVLVAPRAQPDLVAVGPPPSQPGRPAVAGLPPRPQLSPDLSPVFITSTSSTRSISDNFPDQCQVRLKTLVQSTVCVTGIQSVTNAIQSVVLDGKPSGPTTTSPHYHMSARMMLTVVLPGRTLLLLTTFPRNQWDNKASMVEVDTVTQRKKPSKQTIKQYPPFPANCGKQAAGWRPGQFLISRCACTLADTWYDSIKVSKGSGAYDWLQCSNTPQTYI